MVKFMVKLKSLVQGEHFKLSRSLRYKYSLIIILTKHLKTVLEL